MAVHPRATAAIRHRILDWYAREQRAFPWRGTTDPYAVLVSEVMLQQTQASRIAERFPAFMDRFPTVAALADAPPAAVLAAWSGLGYNRRALALQDAARLIAAAGWPTTVESLQALPGVGPYTARAVASLAFGIGAGVVDTNVRRWLLRRFDVADAPAALQGLADLLAAPGSGAIAAAWTHASMEFGAAICRARAPRCDACPVARGCPSRGVPARVAVPRQAAFGGSRRAIRGAILRQLGGASGHRLATVTLRQAIGQTEDAAWETIVEALERERLVHRSGRSLVLGPRPTIRP